MTGSLTFTRQKALQKRKHNVKSSRSIINQFTLLMAAAVQHFLWYFNQFVF